MEGRQKSPEGRDQMLSMGLPLSSLVGVGYLRYAVIDLPRRHQISLSGYICQTCPKNRKEIISLHVSV